MCVILIYKYKKELLTRTSVRIANRIVLDNKISVCFNTGITD